MINFDAKVTLQASTDEQTIPTISIMAYSGGVMNVPGWGPVVIDLAGLDISGEIKILADHGKTLGSICGSGTAAIRNHQLFIDGTLTDATDAGKLVAALARDGIALEASVGVDPLEAEEIAPEKIIDVNGQKITCERHVTLIRKGTLKEISIVSLGADSSTAVNVAATGLHFSGGKVMEFDKWLVAKGIDPATMDEEAKSAQRLIFDAEVEAAAKPEPTPAPVAPVVEAAAITLDADAGIAAYRAKTGAEMARVAAINTECVTQPGIAAQAVTEGWTVDKTKLEVMRADRPQSAAIHAHAKPDITGSLIECAAVMSVKSSFAEKEYGAELCEAAEKSIGRIGLGQMLNIVASQQGYTGHGFRNNLREVMECAFRPQIQAASGFSNMDISGILSNVANKFLKPGFDSVESAWREVSSTKSVSDFKTVTSYRMTGDEMYDKVGPGGEIPSGKTGEQSFTNKADTYGRMFGVTRQDIINDDLGAISDIPRRLGRAGALKINDIFWAEFMDNGSFFTNANGSLITAALASAGLTTGVIAFRKQTDPDGFPIGLAPKILLVSPDLEVDADELFVSTNINSGGSSTVTKIPSRNVHAAKYRPVISTYLSNSSYTGYSTTQWFLLADPMDLSTIEVVFLNGVETPTVESADANFDTLGIQMRGYHDFGVNKQEYRAGVKSTGAG